MYKSYFGDSVYKFLFGIVKCYSCFWIVVVHMGIKMVIYIEKLFF